MSKNWVTKEMNVNILYYTKGICRIFCPVSNNNIQLDYIMILLLLFIKSCH